jgi:hypothetical protein
MIEEDAGRRRGNTAGYDEERAGITWGRLGVDAVRMERGRDIQTLRSRAGG